jgi:hypothetical protein
MKGRNVQRKVIINLHVFFINHPFSVEKCYEYAAPYMHERGGGIPVKAT